MCNKSYESWLTADKVIAIRLTFWATLCNFATIYCRPMFLMRILRITITLKLLSCRPIVVSWLRASQILATSLYSVVGLVEFQASSTNTLHFAVLLYKTTFRYRSRVALSMRATTHSRLRAALTDWCENVLAVWHSGPNLLRFMTLLYQLCLLNFGL